MEMVAALIASSRNRLPQLDMLGLKILAFREDRQRFLVTIGVLGKNAGNTTAEGSLCLVCVPSRTFQTKVTPRTLYVTVRVTVNASKKSETQGGCFRKFIRCWTRHMRSRYAAGADNLRCVRRCIFCCTWKRRGPLLCCWVCISSCFRGTCLSFCQYHRRSSISYGNGCIRNGRFRWRSIGR